MHHPFILSSTKIDAKMISLVGGKAIGLAFLQNNDARVPPFFCITSTYFANFRNELTIDIIDEIKHHLDIIGDAPYAVRSSMVSEDSASKSFAGQLASFLFLDDLSQVCDAIVQCWSSASSERVLHYRHKFGETMAAPQVSVVVQKMINGTASGVLFTSHPISRRHDQILIAANFGLTQGVVNGTCNADEYVLDHDGREISFNIARKINQVVYAPNDDAKLKLIFVDEFLQKIRCLPQAQASILAKQAARLARAYGKPLDIEWTFDGDDIYFLQARPITTLYQT